MQVVFFGPWAIQDLVDEVAAGKKLLLFIFPKEKSKAEESSTKRTFLLKGL